MVYFALFAASPFIAALLYRLLFSTQSTEKVQQKYSAQEESKNSWLKKYPEVSTDRYSGVFLQTGLVLAIAFSLYAFNYAPAAPTEEKNDFIFEVELIEELPPQTLQKPPPPPPPPPPPVIDIVDDEEEIEDEVEIVEVEADEETEIEVVDIPDEIPDDVIEEIDDVTDEEIIEEAEKIEEPEIHVIVEEMPAFPGCEKKKTKQARQKCVNQKLGAFLSKNVKYPSIARENGIEGTVYVGFIVDKDGTLTDIKVERGLTNGGAGCDSEALRVVKKMPKWEPGKQRMEPVKVKYTLPIRFRLN